MKKIGILFLVVGTAMAMILASCQLPPSIGIDSSEASDSGIDTDTSVIETDTETDTENQQEGTYLKSAFNCEEAWPLINQRYIKQMESILLSHQERIINQLNGECDTDTDTDTDMDIDADTDADTDADADSDTDADEDDESDDASETNNQVEGVYEADFVKNDLGYIYILADGRFQIIDAWPADQAQTISSYPIQGDPKKMFVSQNRAFIYSSLEQIQTNDPSFNQYHWQNGECTYGYDCDFVGDGRALKITVLDLSDLTAPKLVRETFFDGSFLNARRIDDTVYTIAVFPEIDIDLSGLGYVPEPLVEYQWACGESIPFTESDIKSMFNALQKKNTKIIQETDMSPSVPIIKDVRYTGDDETEITESVLQGCPDFYISPEGDGVNLITLLSTKIQMLDDYHSATVLGRPGAIYASRKSLYLASRHYQHQVAAWHFDETVEDATTVHKFALAPESETIAYLGSGWVKGRILNQFSMGEHDAHLRIVTTTGRLPSSQVHNTLSILANQGGELLLTGLIDNIAPSEDIRSARFNGDVGFVVTFRETDPLFVLNLSDPKAPFIEGELKIPGFSTYIHLMDDSHLLTIGYDALEAGTFKGIQLQIMDVNDYANPQLIHKEVIGTRGSTSDAATNHLAFNYYKKRNLLAFPMVICENESGAEEDIWDVYMTFSGLLVYDTTVANGFEKLGGIPHETPETEENNGGYCQNWWTNPNSKVKRSVFMEDFVYSIAKDRINVSKADNLATPISSIDLVQ
ncbi:MAG: beta-propeller domain-containing protein [Myxococcota bacterium]|nr:beta-propeller domain-containing protein [Myxococcota bacterium]